MLGNRRETIKREELVAYTKNLCFVKNYLSPPTTLDHKICTKCRVIKPLVCFYILRKSKYETRCKTCLINYTKSYDSARKEYCLARQRKYYMKHRTRIIQRILADAKANPAKWRQRSMARFAMKLQRTPKWLSKEHVAAIARIYAKAAYLTKKYHFRYEVDHIVPLQGKNVSGLHVPWNLRIVSRRENRCKSNKF